MARLSYGGGMFSPIRSDTSLNDVFENPRESDIFSQWKEICVGEHLAKNIEDFSKENSDEKKDNTAFAVKPSDSLFTNKHEKNFISSESSKGKLSYITTRRKNSVQNKQTYPENPPKTSISAPKDVKTNKKKDSLSKYVSVRSEIGKGNEFRESKTGQSSNPFSLPGLTEEQIGVKSLSPENAHSSENRSRNVTSARYDVKKLSNIGDRKEKKLNSLTSIKELASNGSEIRSEKSLTTDCEVQTDLLMSELNSDSGKTLKDSALNSYCQSTVAPNLHISTKPQQIQANIIEKLVKDTVSFEFDGIRQMLYLQQLSLLKHMDKNFEIERQNSSLLTKYIESLMEENRRLRDEVTAYQNFFKV